MIIDFVKAYIYVHTSFQGPLNIFWLQNWALTSLHMQYCAYFLC